MQLTRGCSRCCEGNEVLERFLFISARIVYPAKPLCEPRSAVSETERTSKIGIEMYNISTKEVTGNLRRRLVVNTRAWCSGGSPGCRLCICVISAFRRDVGEICAFLGCCAACSSKSLLTFRHNLSLPASAVIPSFSFVLSPFTNIFPSWFPHKWSWYPFCYSPQLHIFCFLSSLLTVEVKLCFSHWLFKIQLDSEHLW